MKKIYEKPVIEIQEFEVEDILTTSGQLDFLGEGFAGIIGWDDIK